MGSVRGEGPHKSTGRRGAAAPTLFATSGSDFCFIRSSANKELRQELESESQQRVQDIERLQAQSDKRAADLVHETKKLRDSLDLCPMGPLQGHSTVNAKKWFQTLPPKMFKKL